VKVIEVQNATLGILRQPGAQKPWRLTIQDRDDGSVIWVDITDEVARQIVAKLSSGIQVVKDMPR